MEKHGRAAANRLFALCCLLLLGSSLAFAQGKLSFDPVDGPVGTPVTAVATGLEPGTTVTLAWESAAAQWNVDPDGRFLGITAEATLTTLGEAVIGADGGATFAFTVPEDFGYMHNVFVLSGGAKVARQGFTVVPELSIEPTSGPVGTPITVTLTGVGYGFWEAVWHLLYDDSHTGWMSAVSTKGTSVAVVPASGAIGLHTLQVLSGTHPVPYLNQQQAPIYNPQIPTVMGETFEITPGPAVTPRDVSAQSLPREQSGQGSSSEGPTLSLDYSSGTVGSLIKLHGSGFSAGGNALLTWTTTRGNDIISGLVTATVDLGSVQVGDDGTFDTVIPTPDDLGGHHTIEATQGDTKAVASYTITPSVTAVSPSVVAPGGDITVTVKGVGWSDTANIYAFVMNNGYLGYGCGVNSHGDVTVHLKAPGRVGTHFLDIYPSIYRGVVTAPGAPPPPRLEPGQDASLLPGANSTFLQLPMLNWRDHPGEELPAFHLSFEVR